MPRAMSLARLSSADRASLDKPHDHRLRDVRTLLVYSCPRAVTGAMIRFQVSVP